jgi:hypothetical protein
MARWDERDPGLPIKFGPCSNGEYDPVPLSPAVEETIRRAREACDRNARRSGVSRREFLLSVCVEQPAARGGGSRLTNAGPHA